MKSHITKHTIPKFIFDNLQKEARKNLESFLTDSYTKEQIEAMTNEEVGNATADYLMIKTDDTKKAYCSDSVAQHWISIVKGNVPFGYKVED